MEKEPLSCINHNYLSKFTAFVRSTCFQLSYERKCKPFSKLTLKKRSFEKTDFSLLLTRQEGRAIFQSWLINVKNMTFLMLSSSV